MNSTLHQKLDASLKRTKRNFTIVIGVLVLLLLMLGAAIFTDPEITVTVQILLSIFGVGIIFLMLKMGQLVWKPSPLVDLIEHNPSQIKRVEAIAIVHQNGRPSYQMNLHFHTADGKAHVLSDKRTAILELLPLLKAELKDAEFKGEGSSTPQG